MPSCLGQWSETALCKSSETSRNNTVLPPPLFALPKEAAIRELALPMYNEQFPDHPNP